MYDINGASRFQPPRLKTLAIPQEANLIRQPILLLAGDSFIPAPADCPNQVKPFWDFPGVKKSLKQSCQTPLMRPFKDLL